MTRVVRSPKSHNLLPDAYLRHWTYQNDKVRVLYSKQSNPMSRSITKEPFTSKTEPQHGWELDQNGTPFRIDENAFGVLERQLRYFIDQNTWYQEVKLREAFEPVLFNLIARTYRSRHVASQYVREMAKEDLARAPVWADLNYLLNLLYLTGISDQSPEIQDAVKGTIEETYAHRDAWLTHHCHVKTQPIDIITTSDERPFICGDILPVRIGAAVGLRGGTWTPWSPTIGIRTRPGVGDVTHHSADVDTIDSLNEDVAMCALKFCFGAEEPALKRHRRSLRNTLVWDQIKARAK